jgi:hypothetical protein
LDPQDLRSELHEILEKDAEAQRPVCGPSCRRPDRPDCSRHCPDIPRALSSDPENFPLETRIAPLVFELKRLKVFEPCWSCEGHNGPDGRLWKIPRVWFYCRSVVQLRVLADGIERLYLERKLTAPWHVVLTFSDRDNVDTTFSLEPNLDQSRPALAAIQKDIDTLAERLHELVIAEADRLSAVAR